MTEPTPICVRCGRGAAEDELSADEIASGALSMREHLYAAPGGRAHWACMSLAEQRREDFLCERCATRFWDDGRESDAGWIVEANTVLCPNCQTAQEDAQHVADLLATVQQGKRNAAEEGREYPADLAEIAEHERERIARERKRVESLDRRIEGDPDA